MDVIAPPDFILDSPIGRADGEVSAAVPLRPGGNRRVSERERGLLRGLAVAVAEPEMLTWARSALAPSGDWSRSGGGGGSGRETSGVT